PAGGDESGRVHPRSAVQRSITKQLNIPRHQRFEEMLGQLPAEVVSVDALGHHTESRRQALARHNSQIAHGAMAWLHAPPMAGITIPANLMTLALRRAVGHWSSYGRCYYCQSTMVVLAEQEADTHHAITCSRGGLQNPAHNYLRDALRTALIKNGVPRSQITKENQACFHGPASSEAGHRKWKMDLTIAPGGLAATGVEELVAKEALIDVTIKNPCSKT
ncbi:unnamed protein product, partial [Chrysoparadoxa australica]